MSVQRRSPNTAIIDKVCCGETKASGECTTCRAKSGSRFSFSFIKVTFELTLRADRSCRQLAGKWKCLLFALQCVFGHQLGDLCEEE